MEKQTKAGNNLVRIRPDLFQKCLKINSERQLIEKKRISLGFIVNEILEKSLCQ